MYNARNIIDQIGHCGVESLILFKSVDSYDLLYERKSVQNGSDAYQRGFAYYGGFNVIRFLPHTLEQYNEFFRKYKV